VPVSSGTRSQDHETRAALTPAVDSSFTGSAPEHARIQPALPAAHFRPVVAAAAPGVFPFPGTPPRPARKEPLVDLVATSGIAFFVLILMVVPTLVVWRDIARGRPDADYTGHDSR
jgi:hypothetical protein